MERYYFDTSIWIDFYDKRDYNGEVAKKLIEKILLNDFVIIFSDVVIIELKRLGFSEYEINDMANIAKPDNLLRVHVIRHQIEESRRVSKQRGVPIRDALHAILARDSEALLISRDKDFERLKDITKAYKPENLL